MNICYVIFYYENEIEKDLINFTCDEIIDLSIKGSFEYKKLFNYQCIGFITKKIDYSDEEFIYRIKFNFNFDKNIKKFLDSIHAENIIYNNLIKTYKKFNFGDQIKGEISIKIL